MGDRIPKRLGWRAVLADAHLWDIGGRRGVGIKIGDTINRTRIYEPLGLGIEYYS